jgi:hypothetical protein
MAKRGPGNLSHKMLDFWNDHADTDLKLRGVREALS